MRGVDKNYFGGIGRKIKKIFEPKKKPTILQKIANTGKKIVSKLKRPSC